MAIPVIMPRQGQSVESCIISKWVKKKGDRVQAGDVLFTYETDKATFDEEAKAGGILLDIFFQEGDDVPCLLNVCAIGNEGEDASIFNPNSKQDAAPSTKPEAVAATEIEVKAAPEIGAHKVEVSMHNQDGKMKISPRAKNLAEKAGVDLRFAEPSGPDGRIIERDVAALRDGGRLVTTAAKGLHPDFNAAEGSGIGGRITVDDVNRAPVTPSASGSTVQPVPAAAPAGILPEFEEVKLTSIRKVISKAMQQSLTSAAQLTLNSSFDATDILAFRKKLKNAGNSLGFENITINDIILYTVSRTILNHKSLNAHFLDDKMNIYKNANLGIAVDTEKGLMVPTLRSANLKSLNEISSEAKKLAESCQKGTIKLDDLKGGTFTITNLGTLGIESFTPVLNPPQTGILGVNNIIQRVKEVNGQYVYYPAMGLSLTFDHRALDGAPAARFLKDLKENLENFSLLLVK
ncbi:MAG: 2-oxo acid dehydrogenase subunit E2 [Ruminiclostridium sp.]|nr:2-oxo acid dehydrogenase subunit E2 [Ruminiclostridium sp.]